MEKLNRDGENIMATEKGHLRTISYDPAPLIAEMDSLPPELKLKYKEGLADFRTYLQREDIDRENSKIDFPFETSPQEFRSYLAYLCAAYERTDWRSHQNEIGSKNERLSTLTDMIVAMKLTTEGISTAHDDEAHAHKYTLGALERNFLHRIKIDEDHLLLMKFARDAGPEYVRVVSRLMHLVANVTLRGETSREDLSERRSQIWANFDNLYEKKVLDWNMLRLTSEVSEDGQSHNTILDRLAPSVVWQLEEVSKGLSPMEAYVASRKDIVRELCTSFMDKYNVQGELTEKDIDEIALITGITVAMAKSDSKDEKEKDEFMANEGGLFLNAIFAYLGEVIGPSFVQKTNRPMTFTIRDLNKWGIDPDAFLKDLEETKKMAKKITGEFSLSDEVDEKYLAANRDKIAQNYFLGRVLMLRAQMEVENVAVAHVKNTFNTKHGEHVVTAVAILNIFVDQAKTVREMLETLPPLHYVQKLNGLGRVYEKAEKKFWEMPGALHEVLKHIGDLAFSPGVRRMNLPRLMEMLSPAALAKRKYILDDLLKELKNPNYQTFTNACLLAASIIDKEKQHNETAKKIINALFEEIKDYNNPDKIAVIKTIVDTLYPGVQPEVRAAVFVNHFVNNPAYVAMTKQDRQKLSIMLDLRKEDAEMLKTDEVDLGELKVNGDLESRNLDEIIENISENRSIVLSGDGKSLAIHSGDSPLAGNFTEIKLTLNKEGRKYPQSLACHASLKLKEGGTIYLSLDGQNNLIWRTFRQGKLLSEISKKDLLKTLTGKKSSDDNSYDQLLEEIHYLMLKKLEEFYVKVSPKRKDTIVEIQKPVTPVLEIIDEMNVTVGNDDAAVQPEEEKEILPLPSIREESIGAINLADNFTKMSFQNLEEDDDENIAPMRAKIGANRELVVKLFREAFVEGHFNHKELSEEFPEGVTDLIIYKKTTKKGQKFFEEIDPVFAYVEIREGMLKLDDVYIRSASAHSQALPYLKAELPKLLNENEANKINDVLRNDNHGVANVEEGEQRLISEIVIPSKVRSTEMGLRMQAFDSSREKRDISLTPKKKILYVDVDASAEHQVLFERMRAESDEEIRKDIERKVAAVLDEKVREAKAKIVKSELFGEEYQKSLADFASEKERLVAESISEVQSETKAALKIKSLLVKVTKNGENGESATKLRLPQVLEFNQTFNQGRFQSIAEFLELLDLKNPKQYDKVVAAE